MNRSKSRNVSGPHLIGFNETRWHTQPLTNPGGHIKLSRSCDEDGGGACQQSNCGLHTEWLRAHGYRFSPTPRSDDGVSTCLNDAFSLKKGSEAPEDGTAVKRVRTKQSLTICFRRSMVEELSRSRWKLGRISLEE